VPALSFLATIRVGCLGESGRSTLWLFDEHLAKSENGFGFVEWALFTTFV